MMMSKGKGDREEVPLDEKATGKLEGDGTADR